MVKGYKLVKNKDIKRLGRRHPGYKLAKGYKDSDGSIIVKIPKSYLGMSEGEIKPIFFENNGQIRLLPEFIYGYVSVDDKYNCGDIIKNPNYNNTHDYDNEGLLYDCNADVPSYNK